MNRGLGSVTDAVRPADDALPAASVAVTETSKRRAEPKACDTCAPVDVPPSPNETGENASAAVALIASAWTTLPLPGTRTSPMTGGDAS